MSGHSDRFDTLWPDVITEEYGPTAPSQSNGGPLPVLCIGLNHRTAPLQVRDRVSFRSEDLGRAHSALKKLVAAGVILSTCNRTEVYTAFQATDEDAGQVVCQFLAEFHNVDPGLFTPYLCVLSDTGAVRHLFRVASGLDSLILGESQILGQVRNAFMAAAEMNSPGLVLSRLFHHALRTGRRTREETSIGKNALSTSHAAVKLAQRVLGSLDRRSVLLVGAGEAGRQAAKALRNAGINDLIIANRTMSRGQDLAEEVEGSLLAFDKLEDSLKQVDIVLSSTDAPEAIFCHSMVTRAMEARDGRPLFFFDLAVPRDIEPGVADIPGAYLFNIDDLSTIATENRLEREKAAGAAQVIVDEEVARFSQWWHSLEAVPLVKELRAEAEAIRVQELEKALRRLPGLDEKERMVLEQVSQSIVNKLLHRSVTALKERWSPVKEGRDIYQPGEAQVGSLITG